MKSSVQELGSTSLTRFRRHGSMTKLVSTKNLANIDNSLTTYISAGIDCEKAIRGVGRLIAGPDTSIRNLSGRIVKSTQNVQAACRG